VGLVRLDPCRERREAGMLRGSRFDKAGSEQGPMTPSHIP
jgi:hypothetical protein